MKTLSAAARKSGKEIVGHGQALECYLQENHDALNKDGSIAGLVSAEVSKSRALPRNSTFRTSPTTFPYGDTVINGSCNSREVNAALRKGQPAIVLSTGERRSPLAELLMLKPAKTRSCAEAVVAVLKAHASEEWLFTQMST